MVPVLVIATLVTLARSMGHDPVEEITRHTVWPGSQPTGGDMDQQMGKGAGLSLERIELNAAGIDVGATEIYVAVPPDRDPQPVRRFATFTADLRAMAAWLVQCRVTTVAMESTGVYWIPPYEILEQAGIRVCAAMARRGVLTRPVGNVIVLMPPYCTTTAQMQKMIRALREAVAEVF